MFALLTCSYVNQLYPKKNLKRNFPKVGFRRSQRSAEQSTKVSADDCFHTVLNKLVLEQMQ